MKAVWHGTKHGLRGFGAPLLALGTVLATAFAVHGAGKQTEVAPQPWRARVEARQGDLGTGEVYVNDRLVIRLRTTAGTVSPVRRAEIAAERLSAAIAGGLSASDIQTDTATDRLLPRLKGSGQVIASADKFEARANDSSPIAVVRGWASALRAALQVPGIAASDTDILVPLGESRPVRLSGAAHGDLFIDAKAGTAVLPGNDAAQNTAQPAVVAVTGGTDGVSENVFTLRGIHAGRETLTFTRDGASVSVVVRVQPYAGAFNPPKPVIVTGRGGAPLDRVARYAAASALASATVTPGAMARVQTDSVSVAMPLAPGAQSTVTVPVTLSGQDMIAVRRTVSVPLRNDALPPVPTNALMYSNDPERVTGYGTLFAARIPLSVPAPGATRLLFHHQSALPQAATFVVELLNDTDAPQIVQVIGSGAGPVRDTVWVGYRAASDFVRDYLADAGLVVEIPPKSRLALLSTRLAPGTTVSGLMQLRPLSGTAPLVRVSADPPGDARAQAEAWQPAPLLPGEFAPGAASVSYPLSEHIYPDPVKRVAVSHEIGGDWTFVGLGRDPLAATANADKKLFGNYGVFYEIVATVHNGTAKNAKVRALFVPSAGLAGGVFLVDGKYVEVPQTNVGKEPTLASYTLAPGETRTIRITTMPLSGSNYPARIVIRP